MRNSIGEPGAHVVDQQVGVESGWLVGERGAGVGAGLERGRVAEDATDLIESLLARGCGWRLRGRWRRGEKTHERSEGDHVGLVFGREVEGAAGRFISFGGEDLVGDALFDVIGFAGEDGQRFILRFPAEAGDGAVVGIAVFMACDAELGFELRVGGFVSRMVASSMASTRPSPNSGAGMRSERLF